MTVLEVAQALGGRLVAGESRAKNQVLGGYCSDLLSDAMANAKEGDVWVTLQRHANIVAVAHLKGLAGIVLVGGRLPEDDCAKRANEEGIPIVSTPLPAFEVAGLLYSLGLRGVRP